MRLVFDYALNGGVMNREEAYQTIINGYKRYRRDGMLNVLFAVFLEDNDDISVLHLTDRRIRILKNDLKSRDGEIRKKFVGVYNKNISEEGLLEDIEYVKESRDG